MSHDYLCTRCHGPMLHEEDGGMLCVRCKFYVPPLVQGGQGRTDRDVSRAAWIFALCLAGLALLSVAAIVATTILRW